MRRRFDIFFEKVLDRPRSLSPKPGANKLRRGTLRASPIGPLQDSIDSLNRSCEVVEYEGLKQSVRGLIQLLGDLNVSNVVARAILTPTTPMQEGTAVDSHDDLSKELKGFAEILQSPMIRDTQNQDQVNHLASEIERMVNSARNHISQATGRSQPNLLDLSSALRTATERFRTEQETIGGSNGSTTFVPSNGAQVMRKDLDGIPIPGLKAAMGGLLGVIEKKTRILNDEEEPMQLFGHLRCLIGTLTKPEEILPDLVDDTYIQRIVELISDIHYITADAERDFGETGDWNHNAAISRIKQRIDEAMNKFQMTKTAGPSKAAAEGPEADGAEGDSAVPQSMNTINTVEEETILNAIQPRLDNVGYNSSQTSLSFCLPGTRVRLLEEIDQWANDSRRTVFWLSGQAGMGKSTIARTAEKLLRGRDFRVASFVFRYEDDRQSTTGVFATIAYQLAHSVPALRDSILPAINADPNIRASSMRNQLEKLVITPITSVPHSRPTVIILDALNECKNDSSANELLVLLAQAVQSTTNLRILITSRPEAHIKAQLDHPGIVGIFELHELEASVAQPDIRLYVDHQLANIAKMMIPESPTWPSEADKDGLVKLADGLFIFAAVSIEYIGDVRDQQPEERLRTLASVPLQKGWTLPLHRLNSMYRELSEDLVADRDFSITQQVLGTVSLLISPLSRQDLQQLLQLDDETIRSGLKPLYSVLSIPSQDDRPLRIFHNSFSDFLVNNPRNDGQRFEINLGEQHGYLARLCFTHMKQLLRRDFCGIGLATNAEVPNRDELLRTRIPPYLRYACEHWGSHLTEASHTEALEELLKFFCQENLLYWLEILSLAGKVALAIPVLQRARKWCQGKETESLLYDCYRLVHHFHVAISIGPSQIYQSALPFIPKCLLFELWKRELRKSVKVLTGRLSTWSATLFVLNGHASGVTSVIFSPNGKQIASASHDRTIVIWDAENSVQLITLKGLPSRVTSIAYSPDGRQIVSGAIDKTIAVWNAATGIRFRLLRGHRNWVNAVAFAPNGARIISGSGDTTIKVWCTSTWELLRSLRGHSGGVTSVAFSPDNARIISGSLDNTARIWDAETGDLLKILEGHSDSVLSVAFSPDGTKILSGSADRTVCLWDAEKGDCLHMMRRHLGEVNSVAFSLSGAQIASGSKDQVVIVWDAKTGSIMRALEGHSESVESVAFSPSPDGVRIASGSGDQSVIVWDASVGATQPRPEGHLGRVESVIFSPDGKRIASGSHDRSIIIWDSGTGVRMKTLEGHSGAVVSLAYSPDGRKLASGSTDRTIALWDAVTGVLVNVFKGHLGRVGSMAFLPDGTGLVSYSSDSSLFVWDTRTGALVQTLESFSNQAESLYVSHDGQYIISKDANTTVYLDAKTLQQIPNGHSSEIYNLPRVEISITDKWFTHQSKHKLCFLSHDVTKFDSHGHKLAFGTKGGRLYILDFSDCISP
ncbi:hypothetical protein FRC02_010282 [Tulasnella sp. 418]|nr:hypothetical protein FRC02_010282 [Tulasnella sp. 418]